MALSLRPTCVWSDLTPLPGFALWVEHLKKFLLSWKCHSCSSSMCTQSEGAQGSPHKLGRKQDLQGVGSSVIVGCSGKFPRGNCDFCFAFPFSGLVMP